MQLEKLAAVILVGGTSARAAVREVIEHRRAGGDRLEEVAEIAERVAADHLAVVRGQRHRDLVARIGIDVEVVVPEARQHLAQLPAAVHRAEDGRRRHLLARAAALGAVHAAAPDDEVPALLDRAVEEGKRPHLVERRPFRVGAMADAELEAGQALVRAAVLLLARYELRLDPGCEAVLSELGHVLRPRAVSGAPEGRDHPIGRGTGGSGHAGAGLHSRHTDASLIRGSIAAPAQSSPVGSTSRG